MQIDELEAVQNKKINKATTMKDLKNRLHQLGEQWRDEHTEVNENTGKIKVPRVPPRTVTDILARECKVLAIADESEEDAFLGIYDLDEGIYRTKPRFIDKLILDVERSTNDNASKQIKSWLLKEAEFKPLTRNDNFIIVGNGVYNRSAKKIEPFNSDYVFISKISTKYNANAKEPYFEDWSFKKWVADITQGQADKETLLWQMFASVINANFIPEAVFFLIDDKNGQTGKGTLEQLLINLVGKSNFSALKIEEFEQRFATSSIYGSALVIGDDNPPNTYVKDSSNFKSITTGDYVTIEFKGIDRRTVKMTPTIIQSMNGIPKFKDTTGGTQRRLRFLKMINQYSDGQANRKVKEEYIYDNKLLEFILSEAIKIDINQIIKTVESQQIVHEVVLATDMVEAFIEEVEPLIVSSRFYASWLFKLFQAWNSFNNTPTKMGQGAFTRDVRNKLTQLGWTYEAKNKAVLECFHDENLISDYDSSFDNFDYSKTHSYKPLYYKD